MKTKRVKKQYATIREYKAGLLDAVENAEFEKRLNKKSIRELSAFFLEESLTDYEFNYHLRTLNY